jgi:hypothetical protein
MGFMETLIVELNGGGVGRDLEVELIGSAQRHYSIGCHEIKLHLKQKFGGLYRSIAWEAESKNLAQTAFTATTAFNKLNNVNTKAHYLLLLRIGLPGGTARTVTRGAA